MWLVIAISERKCFAGKLCGYQSIHKSIEIFYLENEHYTVAMFCMTRKFYMEFSGRTIKLKCVNYMEI